jgi:hypothetical protein
VYRRRTPSDLRFETGIRSASGLRRTPFSLPDTCKFSCKAQYPFLSLPIHISVTNSRNHSDCIIAPTEVPKCFQFPWTNLSRNINDNLLDLLTHRRSKHSKTLRLVTLEIFAEGVEGASQIISAIIKLFYRTAPKLRKVVVKFRHHEYESQQLTTMRQMNDYLQDRTQNINLRKSATIELLNDRLGLARCV